MFGVIPIPIFLGGHYGGPSGPIPYWLAVYFSTILLTLAVIILGTCINGNFEYGSKWYKLGDKITDRAMGVLGVLFSLGFVGLVVALLSGKLK